MNFTGSEYSDLNCMYGYIVEKETLKPYEKIGRLVNDIFRSLYKNLINHDLTKIRYMELEDIISELNIYFRTQFIAYNRFPLVDDNYFNIMYSFLYQHYFSRIINLDSNNIDKEMIDDILMAAEEQFYCMLFLKSENQFELSYECWKLDIDVNRELCEIYGIPYK